MRRTCCLYCRVSSEGDRQSTTRQVEDLKKFCESNGFTIKGTYEEHISGAKKNEQRKVLMDCLNYCVEHHISVLAVHELSRLGRSTLQVLKSLEMLHEAKVSVYIHNLGLYTLMEDGTVKLADPVSVKAAYDAQDERTLSGNNWDNAPKPFS